MQPKKTECIVCFKELRKSENTICSDCIEDAKKDIEKEALMKNVGEENAM